MCNGVSGISYSMQINHMSASIQEKVFNVETKKSIYPKNGRNDLTGSFHLSVTNI